MKFIILILLENPMPESWQLLGIWEVAVCGWVNMKKSGLEKGEAENCGGIRLLLL